MEAKLDVVWSVFKQIFDLQRERDTLYRCSVVFSSTSYQGRYGTNQMQKIQQQIDAEISRVASLNYLKELHNIQNEFQLFFHTYGIHPDKQYSVIDEISRKVFSILREARQSYMYGLSEETKRISVEFMDFGLCDFDVYPFRYINRKRIIDDILREL